MACHHCHRQLHHLPQPLLSPAYIVKVLQHLNEVRGWADHSKSQQGNICIQGISVCFTFVNNTLNPTPQPIPELQYAAHPAAPNDAFNAPPAANSPAASGPSANAPAAAAAQPKSPVDIIEIANNDDEMPLADHSGLAGTAICQQAQLDNNQPQQQ